MGATLLEDMAETDGGGDGGRTSIADVRDVEGEPLAKDDPASARFVTVGPAEGSDLELEDSAWHRDPSEQPAVFESSVPSPTVVYESGSVSCTHAAPPVSSAPCITASKCGPN